jgi:hypothetical protein
MSQSSHWLLPNAESACNAGGAFLFSRGHVLPWASALTHPFPFPFR